MKILITAGGTKEPIDRVRSITNTSTGRLAAKIHEAWLLADDEQSLNLHIDYVAGEGAVLPEMDHRTSYHPVTDTASVQQSIHKILADGDIDIIIHLMAISDFYVSRVRTVTEEADTLYEFINSVQSRGKQISPELLKSFMMSADNVDNRSEGKVGSKEPICLYLEKTPKIISEMKALCPNSRLIGFKLLDHVSEETLIQVAETQRQKNACEFVVANDLKNISQSKHEAIFVKDGTVFRRCHTKEDIATAIVEELTR